MFSGLATAALLVMLLLLFPVKATYGAGSLRCGFFLPTLRGQSMPGCADSAASNLRVALGALAAVSVATFAVTLWEPRRLLARRAMAALLYTGATVLLLFALLVYAMAP